MSRKGDTFDEHAAIYDLLIDWQRRLKNEEPFYRELFERVGVKRVLDAACGTGRHAAMFHSWNLEVEGADVSEGMLAECRGRFGEPEGLRWVVRAFDRPADEPGTFDAVVCVGNSLALANDRTVVDRAMANFMTALRPGGVCVVQVLNLWAVPEHETVWQKCRRVNWAGTDRVLLKVLRRNGDHGQVDFADLQLTSQSVVPRYDAGEFLGLDADHLVDVARRSGAARVETVGSYGREPYDPATSSDLILVAHRA